MELYALCFIVWVVKGPVLSKIYEPRHEKVCLWEFPTRSGSATEASMGLDVLVTESRDIALSRQRTTKALIRLRRCAGLICAFVVCIRHKTQFLTARLNYTKNYNSISLSKSFILCI